MFLTTYCTFFQNERTAGTTKVSPFFSYRHDVTTYVAPTYMCVRNPRCGGLANEPSGWRKTNNTNGS